MTRIFSITLLAVLLTTSLPASKPPVAMLSFSLGKAMECFYLYGSLFFADMNGDNFGSFIAKEQILGAGCAG